MYRQSGQSIPHLNTASVFEGRTASTEPESRRNASSIPIHSNTSKWRKPAAISTGLRDESDSTVSDAACNFAEQVRPRRARLEITRRGVPRPGGSRNDDGIHAGLTNSVTWQLRGLGHDSFYRTGRASIRRPASSATSALRFIPRGSLSATKLSTTVSPERTPPHPGVTSPRLARTVDDSAESSSRGGLTDGVTSSC